LASCTPYAKQDETPFSQLRDAVTALNSSDESTQREGLSLAREAVDRLEYITKQAA